MPQITRTVVHVPQDSVQNRSRSDASWHAIRIEFVSYGVVWQVSHEDAIPYLPAGASVLESRIALGGLPNISKNAGHLSGSATSANPTYRFADVNQAFSKEIATKTQQGKGTLNNKVSEYQWPVGQMLDERYPLITSLFKDHEWTATQGLIVQCADVNRGLEKSIFNPIELRLREPINAADTEILITHPAYRIDEISDVFIRHHDAYISEPSTPKIAYARIDTTGEIFGYTGVAEDGIHTKLTGVIRARYQTTAQAVEIATDSDDPSKPTITEWVVIDEEQTELVYALITGELYDGTKIPRHWSAGLELSRINLQSFARHAGHFRLRFENPNGVECKSFIESEILQPLAVLSVNGRGQFEWLSTILPTDTDVTHYVFDETNTLNPEAVSIRHIKTDIKPYATISTDWDAQREQFLSHTPILNIDSADYNKIEDFAYVERKGIHAGLHSNAQIRKLGEQYGELLFYEKIGVVVETGINGLEIGEIIGVKFDHIPDDTKNGAPPLDRAMMITEWSLNRATNTTTYTCVATLQIAKSQLTTINSHNVPVEEYRRDGIDIASLPGITINNSIATGGIVLEMGKKYYYVDAAEAGTGLEFSAGLSITVIGAGLAPTLMIFGPFVNKTTIDLRGKSIYDGGEGEDGNDATRTGGDVGVLFSPTPANGTIKSKANYQRRLRFAGTDTEQVVYYDQLPDTLAGVPTELQKLYRALPRIPIYNIAIHDGKLTGLPVDLGGSGGDGGGRNEHDDPVLRPLRNEVTDTGPPATRNRTITYSPAVGLRGGRGGGGLIIVSWGGSNDGKIITSGGPAQADTATYPANTVNRIAPRGGGGRAGGLLWLVDGNWPAPILTNSNFEAYVGDMQIAGDAISGPYAEYENGDYRSTFSNYPALTTNQWQAASRIQYIPANELIQEKSIYEGDKAFENQRDGLIKLHVGDIPPSNADIGDFLISQSELDSPSQYPVAKILRNTGEWTLVDWPNEYVTYQWLLKAYRDDGGSQIFRSNTRPAEGTYKDGDLWLDPQSRITWTLNTSGQDTIHRREGVELGDERLGDPNFVNTQRGELYWYFGTDPNALPTFPVPASGQSIFDFTIDGLSDGYEFVTFDLAPPINASAIVYSGTTAELFWGFPTGATNITGYEVYQNGVPTAIVTGGSHFFSGLTSGQQYRFGVRSINDDGQISGTVEVIVTTNDTGGGGGDSSIPPPTDLQIAFYSDTTGEITFAAPADTTGLTGYEVQRNGVVLTTLPIGTHNYAMNDLTAGTSYAFAVYSVSASGKSQPATVSGTTGGGGGGTTGPTLTVSNVVNGTEVQGPTVSGTTTGIEAGRGVWINHPSGGVSANTDAGGNWSHTFPASYPDAQIHPYVESAAGEPAQDVRGPFNYKQ